MKLGVSGKNWLGPIVVIVVVGLLLWASTHGHTGHSEAAQGRWPLRGISNQTALPSGVGLDPHRVASCSTR